MAIVRIVLFIALAVGLYKAYPYLKPHIQTALGDPRVLGESVISPVANTINSILPANIKIPTAAPKTSSAPVENTPNSSVSASVNPLIEQIKSKASDLAKEQIDNLKQQAGKAFCQALLEKIKSECGTP